jgi:hypothetical protein
VSKAHRLFPTERSGTALVLGVIVLASLVAGGSASGATTAPTFARADYPLFANNYVVGDFNGDGSLDLAGAGGRPPRSV